MPSLQMVAMDFHSEIADIADPHSNQEASSFGNFDAMYSFALGVSCIFHQLPPFLCSSATLHASKNDFVRIDKISKIDNSFRL